MSLFSKPAQLAHGPALVGIFLNILLYGIMLAQCFYYYTSFRRKDPLWIKCYVFLLLITDTVNTVLNIWWIYDVLINYFDDLSALETANWVFASDPALVGITATMVQLFFAHRVWVLIRNPWLVVFIIATALCSVFGGVGTAIAIKFVPRFAEFQKFSAIVIVWLIAAGVCDVTITVALTYHLRKHKRGFNSATDDILNKIIRITVQNGLVTTIWAITDLIVYLASPTGLHLAFNYPLAKLYTNSVMSSLNSRAGWGYGNTTDTLSTSQRDHRPVTGGNRKPGEVFDLRTTGTTRAEVFVDVETHEMVDVADAVKYPQTSSHPDDNESGWMSDPRKHTI